jgi:hypothetical protein
MMRHELIARQKAALETLCRGVKAITDVTLGIQTKCQPTFGLDTEEMMRLEPRAKNLVFSAMWAVTEWVAAWSSKQRQQQITQHECLFGAQGALRAQDSLQELFARVSSTGSLCPQLQQETPMQA